MILLDGVRCLQCVILIVPVYVLTIDTPEP